MMRILYVTNGFPFPLTSGYLRHYFLIQQLSQRHTISLLSLVPAEFDDTNLSALQPYTENVRAFHRQSYRLGRIGKKIHEIRNLAGVDPATRQMRSAIAKLSRSRPYDVAVLSGKHTLPVLDDIRHVPVVADICDAASVRMRGRLGVARPLEFPVLVAKYLWIRRLEDRVLRRASHGVFASGRDRDALVPRYDPRASVIPNGIDLEYWRPSPGAVTARRIVFTGAMHYPPNADAAIHLVRDIFPLVRRDIPTAELWIVGRDPTPKLVSIAAGQPGVTVTGFVSDMRPYLDQAAVFAAPLRFGAGIQNKVLEALAMELPVIASPSAAGGVRTEDGQDPPLQVAEGGESFARAIVQQLDGGLQRSPHAREFVGRHFCWRQIADRFDRILCQVTDGRCTTDTSRGANLEHTYMEPAHRDPSPSAPALITSFD